MLISSSLHFRSLGIAQEQVTLWISVRGEKEQAASPGSLLFSHPLRSELLCSAEPEQRDAKTWDFIPKVLSGVSSVGYYIPAAVTSRLPLCGTWLWVSAEPLGEKPPFCVLLVAIPTGREESKAEGQL